MSRRVLGWPWMFVIASAVTASLAIAQTTDWIKKGQPLEAARLKELLDDIAGRGVPTGSIVAFAGKDIPKGWALCDGHQESRDSALFKVVGIAWGGGDGVKTFNVPDLRGRVAAGRDDMGGGAAHRLTSAGAQISGNVLGAYGGAESHTLTTAQLPAHDHKVEIGRAQGVKVNSQSDNAYFVGNDSPSKTGLTGDGAAFPIVQPTAVVNYIIKL